MSVGGGWWEGNGRGKIGNFYNIRQAFQSIQGRIIKIFTTAAPSTASTARRKGAAVLLRQDGGVYIALKAHLALAGSGSSLTRRDFVGFELKVVVTDDKGETGESTINVFVGGNAPAKQAIVEATP